MSELQALQNTALNKLEINLTQLRKDFEAFKTSDIATKVSAAKCYEVINKKPICICCQTPVSARVIEELARKEENIAKHVLSHVEYSIEKLENKIERMTRIDAILQEKIDKLEASCFTDMKNELIAFKIERNELRKRLKALETKGLHK